MPRIILVIRHIIVLWIYVLGLEDSHVIYFMNWYFENRLFVCVTELVFVQDEGIWCHESISLDKVGREAWFEAMEVATELDVVFRSSILKGIIMSDSLVGSLLKLSILFFNRFMWSLLKISRLLIVFFGRKLLRNPMNWVLFNSYNIFRFFSFLDLFFNIFDFGRW